MFWVGLFLIPLPWAVNGERPGRVTLYGSAVALCLTIIAGTLFTVSAMRDSVPVAIVLDQRAEIHSGPGADNPTLFVVHEGLKVVVRNRSDGWIQVTLPNGLTGWLPDSSAAGI